MAERQGRNVVRGWSALVGRAPSVAAADADETVPPDNATLHGPIESLHDPYESLLESPPTEVGAVPGLASALAETPARPSDTQLDVPSPLLADETEPPGPVPPPMQSFDATLPTPVVGGPMVPPAITGPRIIREVNGPTSRPPPPVADPLANVPIIAPLPPMAPRSPGARGEAETMLDLAVAMGMAPEPAAPPAGTAQTVEEKAPAPYVDAVIPDTPDGTGAAPGALGELRAARPVPQSVVGRIVEERIGGWITLATFFAKFAPLMIGLFLLIAILIAMVPIISSRNRTGTEGRAVYIDESRHETPRRSAIGDLIQDKKARRAAEEKSATPP